MNTFEIKISLESLENFKKEFGKLHKLAVKMGVTTPSYVMGDVTTETVKIYDKVDGEHGKELREVNKYIVEVIPVTLTIAETIKFNGWTLLGTVHHREDIVDLINVETKLPTQYGVDFCTCEHCNTTRTDRVKSFVLQHEDGNYKQVGSTCIDKFVGVKPDMLTKLNESLIHVLEDFCFDDESEPNGFGRFGGDWLKNRKAYDLFETFGVCHHLLQEESFEYVKREFDYDGLGRRFRSNEGHATLDKVCDLIDADDYKAGQYLTDQNYYAEVMNYVGAMEVTEIYDREGEETFLYKIKTLPESTMVRRMEFWRVVWAILTYERETKAAKKSNDFIGTIGEKTAIEATIVDYKSGVGAFGDWELYSMEDATGNSIKKWGTISDRYVFKAEGNSAPFVEIGDTVKAMALVKDHKENRGRNETIITRFSKLKK